MDERMAMSQREVDRLLVLRKVLDGRLTQVAAGAQAGRSPRQIRRLCARLAARGARGLIHGLRGRPIGPVHLDRGAAGVGLAAHRELDAGERPGQGAPE